MHLPVDDLELGRAQTMLAAAGVTAGLQVELIAVPGAGDVRVGLVGGQHARALLGVDRLDHPLVDAALADRTLTMRALIVPGDDLAIDFEHADLGAIAGDDPAASLGELLDPPDRI